MMDLEIKRKIVHALGIFSVLLILIFGSLYASLMMLSASVIFLLVGEYRKGKRLSEILKIKPVKKVEYTLEEEVKLFERPDERPFNGAIMFYLGCFVTTILFEPWIAIASIAVLALGDSVSTLIGFYYGEHKLFLNKKKSWEGSSAFFMFAFLILLFFVNPLKAFLVSLLVAIVEMLPEIEDNLSVPIATGLFLSLLINI